MWGVNRVCCAGLKSVKCGCCGKDLGIIGDICRSLAIFALIFGTKPNNK